MADIVRFDRHKRPRRRSRPVFFGRSPRYWFVKYGIPLVVITAFVVLGRMLGWSVEHQTVVSTDAVGTISIIDGDTIRSNGQRYRLVGYDTPEVGDHARCERERALADAATERLRQLVANSAIHLQRVPCACRAGTEGTSSCNFGRLCGVLTADNRDVASILISEGLAHPYICSGAHCPKRQSWCD
jgi:endonuclease YncB( thermonuclease family)